MTDNYYYIYSDEFQTDTRTNDRFFTTYLQDIWHITPWLTVEAGLYWDTMKIESVSGGPDIHHHMINPRFGMIFRPDPFNTIRLAAFKYLVPRITERIDPFDIAGVPVFRNNFYGTEAREFDLIWEHEWQNLYSFSNIFYIDSEVKSGFADNTCRTYDSRVKGAEQSFNFILKDWAGAAVGYRFLDITNENAPARDRYDQKYFTCLTCVFPSGIFGSACETFRHMTMKNHSIYDNEDMWITDVTFGWQFPGKKGEIAFFCNNLFDSHFNWILDDFIFSGRVPEREIGITLSLIF